MNSSETALVIVGGEHPSAERAAQLSTLVSLIVAADGGYDSCLRLGLVPDAIIGDMDSVQSALPEGEPGRTQVIRWPRDKDFTDTELAIRWAREHGRSRIILLGGGGGRLDHLLAIHALFQRPDGPDRWYTRYDESIYIRDYMRARIPGPTCLSFFPLGPQVCLARSVGLKWPLDGLNWTVGDCGISNETTNEWLELQVDSGALLLVRALGEGDTPLEIES